MPKHSVSAAHSSPANRSRIPAVAIFRKYQQLVDDLSKAQATLGERESINKAKALLMRQRNIDEPRAYRWLRRRAMNENRRIGDIAAELLESAGRTRE